ncbi:unnamed protein product [Spirodela intermedia]|uniref:Dof zinc finger protein n=1 Tax=Spirodela intermedia TaxID=51605 RepID=A0A7I8K4U8_SPIIN|nr:unnamed protein product [Spirodela intermedia]
MFSSHIHSGGILRAAIPSTTDNTASAGGAAGVERPPMEKTGGPAPDGQSLRCPRCDSSNTKFCYYNNYSLSQPRHFCKACKRYWTRGGTLRNVPVGGGCRKNKRVRKSSAAPTAAPPSQTDLSPSAPPLSFLPSSSPIATASGDLGFLFYNLANSAPDVGLPGLPAPYDLSLGFPSNTEEDYLPRLNPIAAPLQSYALFGTQPVSSTTSACLLSSSFKEPQHNEEAMENRQLSTFSGIHQLVAEGSPPIFKDVKPLCGTNGVMTVSANGRSDWEIPSCENAVDFPLYWNAAATTMGGGLWPDSANYGFSIAPLI